MVVRGNRVHSRALAKFDRLHFQVYEAIGRRSGAQVAGAKAGLLKNGFGGKAGERARALDKLTVFVVDIKMNGCSFRTSVDGILASFFL
jgi:hypothetical protein